jgi:hypothetical protein
MRRHVAPGSAFLSTLHRKPLPPVYGFAESHTSILRSARVAETVNALLADALR